MAKFSMMLTTVERANANHISYLTIFIRCRCLLNILYFNILRDSSQCLHIAHFIDRICFILESLIKDSLFADVFKGCPLRGHSCITFAI